jgi:putative oligomerization/nucleic acid binding protein
MRRGPGLVGMAARTAVVAGTATAVSGRVARRQQNKYATQDAAYNEQQAAAMEQGVAQGAPMPAAPPAAQAPTDMAAELKNLADLHTGGALTDEEFAAAKAKILGS